MPEPKKVVEAFDPWKTPQETWQFVTVPEEDPLGKAFPTIRLNKEAYSAGQTYKLPVAVAAYVNDRIKVFNKSCVRLLQPEMAQEGIIRTSDGSAARMPSLS